jgi:hypothetical protein
MGRHWLGVGAECAFGHSSSRLVIRVLLGLVDLSLQNDVLRFAGQRVFWVFGLVTLG